MAVMEIKMNFVEDVKKAQNSDFTCQLAQGYFEAEMMEKRERLNEYVKAYRETEDKDSFNAQYLKTLIDVLENEFK